MKTLLTRSFAAMAAFLLSFSALAGHHGMKKDIVDVAVENGSFTTLVAAVQAAVGRHTERRRAIHRVCTN